MTNANLQSALVAGLFLLLAGCASETATRNEAPLAEAPAPPAASETPAPEKAIDYGSFTADQLFEAITGELSAQRGDLEQAAEIYFELATETRDVGIIERAVQFASATGDARQLLELGLIWAEAAPDHPEPHLLLAFQLLEANRPGQALSHMGQVLDAGRRIRVQHPGLGRRQHQYLSPATM